ncbi:unnamed protein product [Allacma fusca]|uniref:Cytochrome b-c1 complex subunit 8 n=1 Tax=Allacma fusca TaxID=39272 RepID=A0A8J2LKX1_9HEXA|nr:unnamed protein product [Allacma fusca]
MKLTPYALGMGFGHLAKVRGIITFKISPHEQRPFAGALVKGVPNTFRRMREQFFRVVPPFVIGYVIYDQTDKEHKRQMRKDPEKYACDE